MKSKYIVVVLGIAFLCLCGCEEEASPPQPLPLTVEGDAATKAAIEEVLRANPEIYIPRRNSDTPGSSTEYAIQLVKPDPSIDYSILQIKPDPNANYRILFVDPTTNQETTKISPETQKAVRDLFQEKLRQGIENNHRTLQNI